MRTNSGKGEGNNNLHDPTLKEQERARGKSGEAITGEKKADRPADRTPAPSNARKR